MRENKAGVFINAPRTIMPPHIINSGVYKYYIKDTKQKKRNKRNEQSKQKDAFFFVAVESALGKG